MSLFTKGDIAIEYPVTINKTICIPNSNKFQNPLYQESTILKKDVPRIEKLRKLVRKVNTIAKTNASGMFFKNISEFFTNF